MYPQKSKENSHSEREFEELVQEHGASLLQYIISLVRHKELGEDLYQEMLISAYLGFSSFEDKTKFKSWLYKIALNKCRDYWRKEKSAKRFWEEKLYLYTNETQVSQQTEETVLNRYAQKEMVQTVSELPDIYRDPILLFYYQHQTLMEISRKTNLPLSTVKTRLKRGRDRLRPKVLV
ncbi:RNA polymerase sigma factor [Bacillus sp. 03113]|uniref:RNA polymerase sigma factor n=1 Tax=Bacillus sp. 03113 TaxID=2578211 RepID=UPI0011412071|nr:RNA polymerase sigma factor [Bacillus sp. 03113]